MEKKRSVFRRPDAGEQEILNGLEIRLVTLEETGKFNELVVKHHYLKSAVLVGEHMRYVATNEGEWLALGAWSAGAMHLRGRDGWIGCSAGLVRLSSQGQVLLDLDSQTSIIGKMKGNVAWPGRNADVLVGISIS